MTPLNILDLFSGIGGFAQGIQEAGAKINKHYFSEIDKNAISIYKKHFKNAENLGDVSTITDFSRLGPIDLITFGFPCQDLSQAGKRKGLTGARSGLFYEAMRLVRQIKPTYFIFENVKGLLTSDNGSDFVRCLQEIADIGLYECEWQLLNTSWVLPQNRERVYFIGHLRGKSKPKVFPFQASDFASAVISRQTINCITTRSGENTTVGSYVVESKQYEKISKKGKLKSNQQMASCLTGGGHSGGNHSDMDLIIQKTKSNPQGARVNTIYGNSVTLSALGGGQGAKTGLYVVPRGNNPGGYREVENCPTITKSSFEQNNFVCIGSTQKKASISNNVSPTLTSAMGMGGGHVPMVVPVLTPNRAEKRQNGRRFKENGDPAFTLTTQDQHGIYDGFSIRRLTPLECERLQGFPDEWTDGLSDSARYKALGNAVSVPIVKMVIERLLRDFLYSNDNINSKNRTEAV